MLTKLVSRSLRFFHNLSSPLNFTRLENGGNDRLRYVPFHSYLNRIISLSTFVMESTTECSET